MENLTVLAYAIYLPIALVLTYYVAFVLFKNSLVYITDIFDGRQDIAIATNNLFRLGFYLLNIGFALYILEMDLLEATSQQLIEKLSYKVGGFSIYLGIMLFINMFLFFRGKKVAKEKRDLSLVNE